MSFYSSLVAIRSCTITVIVHAELLEKIALSRRNVDVSRLQRKGRLHFHTVPELRRRIRRQRAQPVNLALPLNATYTVTCRKGWNGWKQSFIIKGFSLLYTRVCVRACNSVIARHDSDLQIN